jgi:hypothetical protein
MIGPASIATEALTAAGAEAEGLVRWRRPQEECQGQDHDG